MDEHSKFRKVVTRVIFIASILNVLFGLYLFLILLITLAAGPSLWTVVFFILAGAFIVVGYMTGRYISKNKTSSDLRYAIKMTLLPIAVYLVAIAFLNMNELLRFFYGVVNSEPKIESTIDYEGNDSTINLDEI